MEVFIPDPGGDASAVDWYEGHPEWWESPLDSGDDWPEPWEAAGDPGDDFDIDSWLDDCGDEKFPECVGR